MLIKRQLANQNNQQSDKLLQKTIKLKTKTLFMNIGILKRESVAKEDEKKLIKATAPVPVDEKQEEEEIDISRVICSEQSSLRSDMLRTCPFCRHTYSLYINFACPCLEKDKENEAQRSSAESARSKQLRRIRKNLTGGCVVAKKVSHHSNEALQENPSLMNSLQSLNVSANPPSQLVSSSYCSDKDLESIAISQKQLRISGWYHSNLSLNEAKDILMATDVGTFLIRDSSDSRYLYTLSAQTKCGPINMRISFSKGTFKLDWEVRESGEIPGHTSIVELIESFIDRTTALTCVYEHNKIWNSVIPEAFAHVKISKPLYVKGFFPSLKHLARLCINRHLINPNFRRVLPAPNFVANYLEEYPFKY